MQFILYTSAWQTKGAIKDSFFNVDFKFSSFHTSLEEKKKSIFKQHFMKFRIQIFFQPQVKFIILQYINVPSSA